MDQWWINNWKLVLVIALVVALLDKSITVMNVNAVKKNYPGVDPISIEKNPVQKYFWTSFGLYGGTVIFYFVSVALFFIGVFLLSAPVSIWAPNNKYGVALYLFMMFYGFVILNNIYFYLRYAKLLT